MKILAWTTAKSEPMATLSIRLQNLPLQKKRVCDVAKKEKFLSSFLVMLRFGLRLKMRFFAISMVYWCGILPSLIDNSPFLINKEN